MLSDVPQGKSKNGRAGLKTEAGYASRPKG